MELLIFPILMIGLTWLLLVRPQRARLREREALVNALEVGDTIVTAGGLHGVIVAVDDETMRIEAAPGVELTFDIRAVQRFEGLEPQSPDDEGGQETDR
ncbi:MAG: preprotein translocase subunit YajC [Actinomycetota bacterium]